MGQYEEALADLDQLIEARPYYNGHRYYLRALVHYGLGHRDQAAEDLTWGITSPSYKATLRYYAQGDTPYGVTV